MVDDVDEIRKRKVRELYEAMDSDDEEVLEEIGEMLPWSYRFAIMGHGPDGGEVGAFHILQQGQMIAMTQDQRFAENVVDYFNRMHLMFESGILDGEPEEESL